MDMDMDMELGIGTNDVADASHIAKGKRTKRLRHLSPCAITAAAAISSSSSASEEEHAYGISGGDYGSFSSTTTAEGTDQEEEDMANCLILLAQGKRGGGEENHHNSKIREKSSTSSSNNNNNRRFSEVTTTATAATKIGFYVYECKTCNRTFPSFQALGGHRASHKKPKLTLEEKKRPQQQQLPQSQRQPQPQSLPAMPLIANYDFEETKQGHVIMSTSPPPISLQLGCGGASNNNNNRGYHGGNNNNKAAKVHECSICGSEFTSGQALGGHMRRHRASTNSSAHQLVDIETSCDNKPRNVLELDLNLPAPPEDDHRDSKFRFTATQKSMVFSAPALVGCHY